MSVRQQMIIDKRRFRAKILGPRVLIALCVYTRGQNVRLSEALSSRPVNGMARSVRLWEFVVRVYLCGGFTHPTFCCRGQMSLVHASVTVGIGAREEKTNDEIERLSLKPKLKKDKNLSPA